MLLCAPITFVAGERDPETPHVRRRHQEWRRFADVVELALIPGAGHYFLKHQADELAGIIAPALLSDEGAL